VLAKNRMPVSGTTWGQRAVWHRLVCIVTFAATLALPGLVSLTRATPTGISEFSAGLNKGSQPEDIVAGSDGNFWFVDRNQGIPDPPGPPAIGRVTPNGTITEFSNGLNARSTPWAIVPGADGNLWFTDRGSYGNPPGIGRISPSGTIRLFSTGLDPETEPRSIVAGADTDLWFTANGDHPAVGRISPDGAISEFPLGGAARGIVIGLEGNPWFTYGGELEGPAAAIGRVTEEEGDMTTITLFRAGLNAGSWPADIITGPDGNLWFTDPTGAIGRVTPDGDITEFSAGLSPNGRPRQITSGPEGSLWFTDYSEDGAVGRVTPTGTITEFRSGLNEDAAPNDIMAAPDGNLWFTDLGDTKALGRLVPGDDSLKPEGSDVRYPGGGADGPPLLPVGQVSLPRKTIAVRKNGEMVLSPTCMGAFRCAGRLTISAEQTPRASGRKLGDRPIGVTAFSIPGGIKTPIKMRINRAGRMLIQKNHGHLRAKLAILTTVPSPTVLRYMSLHLFEKLLKPKHKLRSGGRAETRHQLSDIMKPYRAPAPILGASSR
jgi:virginiamycin B lyase